MDYYAVAVAAALFLTSFWLLIFKDSTKVALSLIVLGSALAYDAVPRGDLPRGVISGAAFAFVVLAWIVGAVVVIQRQRSRNHGLT